jgi:predicted phosphohydrolase
MKIQYASDLHLEFSQNKKFLQTNPIQPLGDVLLLAGDIVLFKYMDDHDDFFKYVSDNFEVTYWIPGNHEYYHFDASKKTGSFKESIKDNVFLVNNISVQHEDVKLVFTTLWSKISPAYELQIEDGMNDFHVIKYKGKRFSSTQFNLFHKESLQFLNKELNYEKNGKTVVVTHHVPTLMNYPAIYKTSMLNQAFAVELGESIEASGPDYWVYGHSHFNTPDFKIKNTRLLTNQMGYVQMDEHKTYKNNALIDI